jgi:hypothetical protein
MGCLQRHKDGRAGISEDCSCRHKLYLLSKSTRKIDSTGIDEFYGTKKCLKCGKELATYRSEVDFLKDKNEIMAELVRMDQERFNKLKEEQDGRSQKV